MLPTPSTSHITFTNIYEPAEDSFLLLDTLSSTPETTFLQSRFPPSTSSPLILEIGTGSGVVLAFTTANAKHIFARTDVASLGTDVNSFACKATRETVRKACTEGGNGAGIGLGCVQGDLATSLRKGVVDVLIFNPPYVPTETAPTHPVDSERKLNSSETFDRDSHLLSLSYAGGVDGMEITNRLLDDIPEILSPRGVAYILLCAQNKPAHIIEMVKNWSDEWQAEQVSQSGKTAGWEKLCVVRIWKEI